MMKKLGMVVLASVSFALVGCGGGKSKSAAQALMGGASDESGSNAELNRVRAQFNQVRRDLRGLTWLNRFEMEAGQSLTPYRPHRIDQDNTSICVPSGSTITCTLPADDTYTCKDETYTMKAGSKLTLTQTNSGDVYTLDIGLVGTVTGGDLDDSSFDCKIGITFDVAKMLAAIQAEDEDGMEEAIAVKCGIEGYACKVDGDDVDCDDLTDATQDPEKSCMSTTATSRRI